MEEEKGGPARNASFDWSEFDSEYYFNHYYGEPHVDDDNVIRLACEAFKHAEPAGTLLETVDVGTGPNLFPLMCASPRASKMTAWEYAQSNVRWLENELADSVARTQWQHFWQVTRNAYAPEFQLPEEPLSALRDKAEVRRGSVYELPERSWDAATMFFCAESITEKRSEFDEACQRFARCVRRGGTLVAAFLVGSSGYAVAERPFPVLNVSEVDILEVFKPLATDVRATPIGIVEEEIRSGYSGMLFLTGRSV